MNEEKHKTLSELEIKYETELKDQKIEQINQNLAAKKAQNVLLIVGVILLILIAGFIIFFLVYRNKTLKQLYERKFVVEGDDGNHYDLVDRIATYKNEYEFTLEYKTILADDILHALKELEKATKNEKIETS